MTNWWKKTKLHFHCSVRCGSAIKKIFVVCSVVTLLYLVASSHVFSSFFKQPAGLGYPEQSSPKTPSSFESKSRKHAKRILFWTGFYEYDPNLSKYCVTDNVLKGCAHTNCEFTVDKDLLSSSHAVVFHGRNLKTTRADGSHSHDYIELPNYRSPRQLWIFFLLESPLHTLINLKPFDQNVFNMTMTYRPDSDIYIPYGRLVRQKGNDSHSNQGALNSTSKIKNKRLVAWAVSNCYSTPSRRGEVVDELRKYIPVDSYGRCGSLNCTPRKASPCDSGLECHEYLGSKYKFYLAFENSLCEDYITEKFYDALYVGMVPVVHGYGDYSRVAPRGSYINVRDFPTTKSLADYLLHLDKTPSEYDQYFEWRKHFRVEVFYFKQAWCSLCTKLWTDDGQNVVHQVRNLSEWWFHKNRQSSGGVRNEPACTHPT